MTDRMNSEHSPSPSPHRKLEIRSWYLIGLVCVIMALLIVGEYFTFQSPVSGEIRPNARQQKTVTGSKRSQILSSDFSDDFASVKEL
jgi:hypothetical protein